jgi:hypothetical protein
MAVKEQLHVGLFQRPAEFGFPFAARHLPSLAPRTHLDACRLGFHHRRILFFDPGVSRMARVEAARRQLQLGDLVLRDLHPRLRRNAFPVDLDVVDSRLWRRGDREGDHGRRLDRDRGLAVAITAESVVMAVARATRGRQWRTDGAGRGARPGARSLAPRISGARARRGNVAPIAEDGGPRPADRWRRA